MNWRAGQQSRSGQGRRFGICRNNFEDTPSFTGGGRRNMGVFCRRYGGDVQNFKGAPLVESVTGKEKLNNSSDLQMLLDQVKNLTESIEKIEDQIKSFDIEKEE